MITPQRRYSADEKGNLLAIVVRAQELCPDKSLDAILSDLGLPPATYYRWGERKQQARLTDHIVVLHHVAIPPTPDEVAYVRAYAERQGGLGYKRLAYSLMLENEAFSLALA